MTALRYRLPCTAGRRPLLQPIRSRRNPKRRRWRWAATPSPRQWRGIIAMLGRMCAPDGTLGLQAWRHRRPVWSV